MRLALALLLLVALAAVLAWTMVRVGDDPND